MQLFRQVQSHQHVISELIQNAEDAGASRVSVELVANELVFRHDGSDFSEEQFESLCQFGLSNKRNVWSLGFRGMGFKSVFSLGSTVSLRTPTLAVRFEKRRFTYPIWEGEVPPRSYTEIRARIETPELLAAMTWQLERWAREPLPLLFLEGVREVSLGDQLRTATPTDDGPLPAAQHFLMEGSRLGKVCRIVLDLGRLPGHAVEEIRAERGLDDGFEIPPIRAVAVLGRSVPHRFYAVLPTHTEHAFPVAIHAPFMLDPARTGLRHPAESLANRWMLERIGEELSSTLLRWLQEARLPLEDRAAAYGLLPSSTALDEARKDAFTGALLNGFERGLEEQLRVLGSDGSLWEAREVVALAKEFTTAWGPDTARKLFAPKAMATLAPEAYQYVKVLERWTGLKDVEPDRILERLADDRGEIPSPGTFDALARVWKWCFAHFSEGRCGSRDERWWQRAWLIPLRGSLWLGRRAEIVALPANRPEGLDEEVWNLLTARVQSVDPEWLRWSREPCRTDLTFKAVCRNLGFNQTSRLDELWRKAVRAVFSDEAPDEETVAKLIAVGGTLGVKADEKIRDVIRLPCRDGTWRALSKGIFLLDPSAESVLPQDWVARHALDDGLLSLLPSNRRQAARRFLAAKDGLEVHSTPLPEPSEQHQEPCEGDRPSGLDALFRERGAEPPKEFPLERRRWLFRIADHRWPEWLVDHLDRWQNWVTFVRVVLGRELYVLSNILSATVFQLGSNRENPMQEEVQGARLPAEWVTQLRARRCLIDEDGVARRPAELLWPTSENEELATAGFGVVLARELSTDELRKILLFLGVRQHATNPRPIVGAIREFRDSGTTVDDDLVKLYCLLNQVLAGSEGTPEHEDFLRVVRQELPVPTELGWRRAAESFQRNPDRIPAVPVIVTDLQRLELWTRLGVPGHPTPADAISWLSHHIGDSLTGRDLEAARKVLHRYAESVARESLWVDLSGAVRSIQEFSWRAKGLYRDLAQWLCEETADLSMLEDPGNPPPELARLPALDRRLERRLAVNNSGGVVVDGEGSAWVHHLGECLQRVSGARDGVEVDLEQLHTLGAQLRATRVELSARLQVLYILDERPVSRPSPVLAFWEGVVLHIQEPLGPNPAMEDAVVQELGRNNALLERIVRAAYCRHRDWIQGAVRQWLEVGVYPTSTPMGSSGPPGATRPTVPPVPGPVPDMKGSGQEPPPGPPTRAQGGAGWIIRSLVAHGFHWDDKALKWCNDHGAEFWKTGGRLFPWAVRSGVGQEERRAILHAGPLSAAGLIIDAEAWSQGPSLGAVLVELDDTRIALRPFEELHALATEGALGVTPSKLRVFPIR